MNRTIIMGLGIALLLAGCGRSSPHRGIYDRAAVKIEDGQMAKVTHPAGVAVVDFTSFRPDGATYRWRFLSNSNNLESSGNGEVKDTSKKLLRFLSYQSHSDTNCYVRAGGLWMAWSYGSTHSAWLYYTKGRTEVVVLPNSGFETEELSSNPAHATGVSP
ncbi:MAG: hypothetical protein WCS01_15135 [bacterium]